MKVTDAFLGEHGAFYAQFDWLEEALTLETPAGTVPRFAEMLASALEPHARLENELLFGPLEAAMGGGPASVMRMEHEQIEGLLGEAARAGDEAAARTALLEAIRLAREHFLKEERIAFPMAESTFGPARLEELAVRWAQARGVTGVAQAGASAH